MSPAIIPRLLAMLLSILIALASWRFIVFGVEASMAFMLYHAEQRPFFFFAHVGFAPLALLLMPFQFWAGLRARRPQLHRWTGRIYGLAILISGSGGLFMAINTEAGLISGLGFGALAVLWLGTTARGIWLARDRRFGAHRIWMIRSAALTFAAVTLRLYIPISQIMGWPFDVSYSVIAWACWVPNILLVEIWLRRRTAAL